MFITLYMVTALAGGGYSSVTGCVCTQAILPVELQNLSIFEKNKKKT